MLNKLSFGWIVVLILLILGGCGVSTIGYRNGLVAKNENVNQSFAQVQNVLQRRMDLIPNLVATVQGAANFEQGTLVAVTEARASVGRVTVNATDVVENSAKMQAFFQAQNGLSQALSRLMVVAENYPTLKANESFMSLQAELAGTENRISVERGRYNEAVRNFNVSVKLFPLGNIVRIFEAWPPRQMFEAQQGAEKAPTVKFDFKLDTNFKKN